MKKTQESASIGSQIPFAEFAVEIEFTEPVLGTCPMDPEVYRTYIEKNKFDHQAKRGDLSAEIIAEQESSQIESREERGWTGFWKDEKGIYVYDYWIKGFVKNAVLVLKEVHGVKNPRSKVGSYLFIFPRRVHFYRDGSDNGIGAPDGVLERPLRAMTMQGPRVTLTRSDMLQAGTRLSFTIKTILANKEVTDPDLISMLLSYGQYEGLGQFRSGSYGRFKVVSMERK